MILRGEGETTLWGGGGGDRPGKGWNGETGRWDERWFLGWGKAGRMRAAKRRGELLLFVTSSSRSNRHGL